MAYNPTVWETGDIITSERLNKMEQGILDAETVVVHVTSDGNNMTADLGLDAISLAVTYGKPVFMLLDNTLISIQVNNTFTLGGAVMGLNALGANAAVFVHISANSDSMTYRTFSIAADRSVTMTETTYAMTPSP